MIYRSLILLRGLPGSGKSSLAAVLCEGEKYPVFSIDSFFTDDKTDEYRFDHLKNHLAYKQCEDLTHSAMEKGCEKIFVDNTFTLEWEMAPYFKMASEFNYRIYVVTVENYHGVGNIHQVTNDQLKKMASKYKVKLM
jgi:predicted kinase